MTDIAAGHSVGDVVVHNGLPVKILAVYTGSENVQYDTAPATVEVDATGIIKSQDNYDAIVAKIEADTPYTATGSPLGTTVRVLNATVTDGTPRNFKMSVTEIGTPAGYVREWAEGIDNE